jgi:hypothetical protein
MRQSRRRCLWRLIRSPAAEIDDDMTVFMASVPRRAQCGRPSTGRSPLDATHCSFPANDLHEGSNFVGS